MKTPNRAPPMSPEYKVMVAALHGKRFCPQCGNEMREEKAVNLRNGAERVHWHCPNCDYDTSGMYEKSQGAGETMSEKKQARETRKSENGEGNRKLNAYLKGDTPRRFKLMHIGNFSICANPKCLTETETVVYYPSSDGPGGHTKAILECGRCGWPIGREVDLIQMKFMGYRKGIK